ncbi:MAG TPA: ABC-2 family transporter protein [Bacillota bacterium]|nr:ABC-2 family transporter protein [Bacillota bacterium]
MRGLQLYFKYIRLNLLTGLQYKGWPLMLLQVMVVVVTDPIGVIFLFSRFGNIGVWSPERIILIYAIAVTSFGLAETFCRGFDYFPWRMIRSGEFDRVLLRPRSLLVQIAGSYFHIHRLARVISGTAVILWCFGKLGTPVTPLNLITLFLALCGGFLAYSGVFVMTSGIAFFTIHGLDWIYIFTNASYHVTRCPVNYMPKALKYVFTFFMPMLVISYYPASAICGWGESYWKGLLALPAGVAFLGLALVIWNIGVRHYQSTGS